jgi:hypothetical protein
MNREELLALQSALEAVLNWPPAVRDKVARWLAPEAAKPDDLRGNPAPAPKNVSENNGARDAGAGKSRSNGHDPHSPPASRSPPLPAKARRNGTTAGQKLLQALQQSPGASVAELARAVGGGRSTVAEQLRQLGRAGTLEKDAEGHWRVAGEQPDPMPAPLSN